ncbi:carotenoid oxygenase family protein [Nonomuraea spiralis]|uniref:Dioxygenase n=1 Tax=Nonomuraea spiralis TaxID=46182 RepID=A0ABV5I9X3_9ACTN|nr:carotenoid oxygenase family protein [Nonomuraea spiralis]GGT05851.1 carotenoid cleavage dioxygenase [Nonomuraea spiralis]
MSYMAPVPDEIDAYDLPVSGALPPELTGRYVRNGPNPLPGERPGHWFNGHGMLHGIRLRHGRAEWYRNRWVRTGKLAGLPYVRPGGGRDLTAVSANTHVIEHAGRVLALVENGLPYRISPDLGTDGPLDFGGRLTTAMTAHPKQDPVTGELHFFGYGVRPPYLTYHRLDASGELVHSREVAVPGGTMTHDFAITEHHVVWLDLPVTFQPHLAGRTMPYQWDDGYGARLGVMRHDRPGAPVRWFDVEPCYVFHVGNAHEDASGRIVLDAVRYGRADFTAVWRMAGGSGDPAASASFEGSARLHRWVLDPATGTVREQALDDRAVEFPTLDDDRVGRPARYLYTSDDSAIVKYDLAGGGAGSHRLEPGTYIGEAVFVPAVSGPRGEDDGWLLSIATRHDGSASRLLVLDASNLAAPPVAAVDLPRAVPAGFHGSWIPDAPRRR